MQKQIKYVRRTPHNPLSQFFCFLTETGACVLVHHGLVHTPPNFQQLVLDRETLWLGGVIRQDPVTRHIFVFREFSYDGTRAVHRVDFQTGEMNQSWLVNNHGHIEYDMLSDLTYVNNKFLIQKEYFGPISTLDIDANVKADFVEKPIVVDGLPRGAPLHNLQLLRTATGFVSWWEQPGDVTKWGRITHIDETIHISTLPGIVPTEVRLASTDENFVLAQHLDNQGDQLVWTLRNLAQETTVEIEGGPELLCVVDGKLRDVANNEALDLVV